MRAGIHQVRHGEMQCRLAACRAHRADAALERRDALFQHSYRGVGDARIDMSGALQIKQRRRMLGVFEDVRGSLIDRHGARAGHRIGPLSGV